MCGFCGIFGFGEPVVGHHADVVAAARRIRHRGPDCSGVWKSLEGDAIIAHERLSIVDPEHGEQPLISADESTALAVNGEIYNHARTITYAAPTADCPSGTVSPSVREAVGDYAYRTRSDCEVVNALYAKHRTAAVASWVTALDGIYAFALYDRGSTGGPAGRVVIGRDAIGVVPLYVGRAADGSLVVGSELKAVAPLAVGGDVAIFPPGCVFDSAAVVDPAAAVPFRLSAEVVPPVGLTVVLPAAAAAAPAALATGSAGAVFRAGGPLVATRWFRKAWHDRPIAGPPHDYIATVRSAVEAAVVAQLMCDVPYGVLVSGGLDSSVVGAVAARHAAMRVEDGEATPAHYQRLHSFATGLVGSPDLAASAEVAAAIGSVHHPILFTVAEAIDALPAVIDHIETFDVTTVRASTPMFLLARRIKAHGVKMVLSGEGADELLGGYLYFHAAPSPDEFHAETVRKVSALHLFDCARANKACMAWGVEPRVPLLSDGVVDLLMSVPPSVRMAVPPSTVDDPYGAHPRRRIEKFVLRAAFEDLLPQSVAWRQKEQFSDGVGYAWIDGVRAHAEAAVSDAAMAAAAATFPTATPRTKEGYLYRSLFDAAHPHPGAAATVPYGDSVACSTAAAVAWDPRFKGAADPSGRSAPVHSATVTK